MLYILGLFAALAVLGPLFGADSRDGLDWTPNNFWLRRRPAPAPSGPVSAGGTTPRNRPVRKTGSRGRATGDRASAGASRTIPAAG